MNLKERMECLRKAFPSSPCTYFETKNGIGRLEGTWQTGHNYKGSGYYGSYPGNYLQRVESLFPDICLGSDTLHIFSGSLPPGLGITVDINPENLPDFLGNAEHLSDFAPWAFHLIIADPPYNKENAKKYGYPMINRRKVLVECWKVLKPGGCGWFGST